MRLRWTFHLAILAAQTMGAATIDVSAETGAVVHTGDTLVFHLFTGSFNASAAAFGLPAYPTDVNFAFVSGPVSGAGDFAATLESADGGESLAFGTLSFSLGYFEGSEYVGVVSTLQGYLHLSPLLSEELFSAPSAIIALRNEGPDLAVGLAPYTLRQDLYANLSGGPLSVGATLGSVDLERAAHGAVFMGLMGGANYTESGVPEPQSRRLLLGGVVLLCGFYVVRGRARARAVRDLPGEKSTICIR